MGAFTRNRRTKSSVATFSAFEADLLRSLASQMIELLRSETATPSPTDELEALLDFSGPTTEPEDPVLRRLFPSAYAEDPEAAGEFRRFTESTLRSGKAASAEAVVATLEEAGLPEVPQDGLFIDVELDREQSQTWLRAFTDMRLAIGTRLEVEDDDEDYWTDLPEDDPRKAVHEIYMWLGLLQESLVHAVMRG